MKLRAARGWKEASGLKKQWKGSKTTTHLCKNIRRWDIEKISTWVGAFLYQHTNGVNKVTKDAMAIDPLSQEQSQAGYILGVFWHFVQTWLLSFDEGHCR